MEKIYLSSPHMGGEEQRFIQEAFETNWIAPLGPHVQQFEQEIVDYVESQKGAALSSGTAAIHLALKALGVGEGDIVFCSTLTFVGSCNPILYEKAVPVFIDSEEKTWNMSPKALKQALEIHQPKAVIVVNLYGQSADMETIKQICDTYGVPIIEDAAESLGATYKGKMSGTFGKLGIYSFNGNKIITTSGGGMVISKDETIIDKIHFWSTQSKEAERYYQHKEVGYNYRMSNISAAIGRGQLRVLEERIHKKKEIYQIYKEAFADIPEIEMMPINKEGESNYWLSVMTLKADSKVKPIDIIETLQNENIESRHVWKPMHLQPLFEGCPFYPHKAGQKSIAEDLFERGVCLPSDTKMTLQDIQRVIKAIRVLMLGE